ncbi:B2 bradykinin receptor isoform X2 [Alosa sapidissima]|uniref:B2 bradykinin receptor isoform X2 n=1 Tax=Alosa sapidissima TaxID=34773 RepID=UPI001C086D3A|nr:B2 bradykinin receptor isoform X2 [Alosa sapidissima]
MTLNASENVLFGIVHGDEGDCNHTEAWEWVYTMQPAYMSAICTLGIAGNAFVLAVLCLQRQHRTVADIYLGNLAAADLLMVCCLPFWISTILHHFNWAYGTAACKLVGLLIGMNYLCTVLFLTVVSVDRYAVLAKPLTHRPRRRVTVAWAVCAGVWALGGLLSFPALLYRSVDFIPDLGVEACQLDYPHPSWRIRFNVTANLVGFVIPVPVVAFSSYHIVRILNDKRVRRSTTGHVERRAAFLVLVMLAVFVLCWLPFQLVMFLDTLHYYEIISGCHLEHSLDIWTQLATYIGYSNSAINPFLYVIVGKHFRQRADTLLNIVLSCDNRQAIFVDKSSVRSKYTECSTV